MLRPWRSHRLPWAAPRRVKREPNAGTVRVTASEIMGCEVLPAILASFRHKHPGIVLELALTNRNEDLLRRDADIAVRMVRPTQNALVARRIGKSLINLYAHQSYVKTFGTPQSIAELDKHCLIGFDRDDLAFRSVGSTGQADYARYGSAFDVTATWPSLRR